MRREVYGELVQIDGSEHRWFEDRNDPCSLLVFIYDATCKLMQLRFVRSESACTHFEALELYLKDHGAPVAFYPDKHSVFRVARKDAKGGQGMTQFGRALCDLNMYGGGHRAMTNLPHLGVENGCEPEAPRISNAAMKTDASNAALRRTVTRLSMPERAL